MHVPSLNFDLGEDIDLLRQSVAHFAAAEVAPLAAEADASNQFPLALWPKLGEQGLLGLTVEEEYGGTGMGYLAHVVAMEEISRASGGIGLENLAAVAASGVDIISIGALTHSAPACDIGMDWS